MIRDHPQIMKRKDDIWMCCLDHVRHHGYAVLQLLIDQPKENLDNQTVFGILVPCINEARRQRQIVLVTHNPNLAVVCDADQIIRADLDVDDHSQLSYDSGAIENPIMSAAVVDVLDGTKLAFEKREHKYVAAMPDWVV